MSVQNSRLMGFYDGLERFAMERNRSNHDLTQIAAPIMDSLGKELSVLHRETDINVRISERLGLGGEDFAQRAVSQKRGIESVIQSQANRVIPLSEEGLKVLKKVAHSVFSKYVELHPLHPKKPPEVEIYGEGTRREIKQRILHIYDLFCVYDCSCPVEEVPEIAAYMNIGNQILRGEAVTTESFEKMTRVGSRIQESYFKISRQYNDALSAAKTKAPVSEDVTRRAIPKKRVK